MFINMESEFISVVKAVHTDMTAGVDASCPTRSAPYTVHGQVVVQSPVLPVVYTTHTAAKTAFCSMTHSMLV